MVTYRLAEKHPLQQKFNKLEQYMEKLKIEIHWCGNGFQVIDLETGLITTLVDAESNTIISQLPYLVESKLIYERG